MTGQPAHQVTERSFDGGDGYVLTVDLLLSSDVAPADAERVADGFFRDHFSLSTVADYATIPSSWPTSKMPLTIVYNQSQPGEPSLKDAGDFAAARWNATPGNTYRLVSGGMTTATAGACEMNLDGQNTVTFQDPGGPSVLALTCVVANNFNEIVEADIIFNPNVLFSSDSVTPPNAYDLWSVAPHSSEFLQLPS